MLHVQGDDMCIQPVVDSVGALLWNGEVFGGIPADMLRSLEERMCAAGGVKAGGRLSDTYVVSALLAEAFRDVSAEDDCAALAHKAAACLACIEGEQHYSPRRA